MATIASLNVYLNASAGGFTKGVQSATKETVRLIKSLEDQAQTFNMTSEQAKIYRAELAGVDKGLINTAKAALRNVEALRAQRNATADLAGGMRSLQSVAAVLRGGGFVAGAAIAIDTIRKLVDGMVSLRNALDEGRSMREALAELFKGMPIADDLFHIVRGFQELALGTQRMAELAKEAASAMERVNVARAGMLEQGAGAFMDIEGRIADLERRARAIGMSGPDKAMQAPADSAARMRQAAEAGFESTVKSLGDKAGINDMLRRREALEKEIARARALSQWDPRRQELQTLREGIKAYYDEVAKISAQHRRELEAIEKLGTAELKQALEDTAATALVDGLKMGMADLPKVAEFHKNLRRTIETPFDGMFALATSGWVQMLRARVAELEAARDRIPGVLRFGDGGTGNARDAGYGEAMRRAAQGDYASRVAAGRDSIAKEQRDLLRTLVRLGERIANRDDGKTVTLLN